MLDAPERVDFGGEQVLRSPDRVIGRERPKPVFFLGEDLLDQSLETLVELRLPQQASAKIKPPCSAKSRRFCLALPKTPARCGR